jgi:hypothetical protein
MPQFLREDASGALIQFFGCCKTDVELGLCHIGLAIALLIGAGTPVKAW